MKRRGLVMLLQIFTSIFLLLGLILASAYAQPKPATEKTFHLKYAGFMPKGQVMEVTPEWWGKEVEERTGGRVKVDLYFGQTLGKVFDFPKMVRGGVCDMATFTCVGAEFPMLDIFDAPGVVTNRAKAVDAFWAVYCKGLLQELNDYKVLWFQPSDPMYVILRKKKVDTIEDFKGMKIRSRPGFTTAFIGALEATGMAMPAPDVFMALDRGIIDGLITSAEYAKSAKLNEVTKYWIWEPSCTGGGALVVAMNRNVWNSLPPDIQAIMEDLNAKARYKFMELFDTPPENRLTLKKLGWEVYELSSGEQTRWLKVAQQVVDKWSAEMVTKGLPAHQVLDTIKRINELCE
jgi:TRAP-type C4-dicarboxylate transport system substrate-binding protein